MNITAILKSVLKHACIILGLSLYPSIYVEFILYEALRPNQHFFCHAGTVFWVEPVLHVCLAQGHNTETHLTGGESRTSPT